MISNYLNRNEEKAIASIQIGERNSQQDMYVYNSMKRRNSQQDMYVYKSMKSYVTAPFMLVETRCVESTCFPSSKVMFQMHQYRTQESIHMT
jgi:hypothetical protein